VEHVAAVNVHYTLKFLSKTNSIELSPREATSRSATQVNPNILWNPIFHCHVHSGHYPEPDESGPY
jgi:hypothetical protein